MALRETAARRRGRASRGGARGRRFTPGRGPRARGMVRRGACEGGQMTVELLVVLPVALVVAVIAVNALTFFGDCAAFDLVARSSVRVCAASPGYGQDLGQSADAVRAMVEDEMGRDNLAVSVEVERGSLGLATFTVTLRYVPTLFGMGLRDEVLGVRLPALTHRTALTVDPYKPGMLF